MNLPFDDFTQKYVRKVGYRFSLVEKSHATGHACVFFDEQSKKCGIYEVRPKQCRTFPFWEGYKDTESADYDALLKMCLGIRVEKKSD